MIRSSFRESAMRCRVTPLVALLTVLVVVESVWAQPAFRLDVKPDLHPIAALRLDGKQIARSAVFDDPGFRLQYHVRQDGKTVATIEARSRTAIDVPKLDPGDYRVTLEVFYPAYKGGTAQKGEFKAISNEVTYRVESAERIVEVHPPPSAALRAAVGMGIRASGMN
jgi:hypothetical protein